MAKYYVQPALYEKLIEECETEIEAMTELQEKMNGNIKKAR